MTVPPPFHTRRDAMALACVIAVALAFQLPMYNRWISLLDEGAILQIADQINHGGVLYRDAVHVAFPGVFYLTAALFRLFGTSFLVGRVLMMVVFTSVVILIYVLARMVAGRGVALGAALLAAAYRVWAFPHWHMLSYTPLALLLLTVAVAVVAVDIRRPHPAWPFVAGLATGLGAVFKQDCSSFVALGLGAFVLVDGVGRQPARALACRLISFGLAAALPPTLAVLAFAPAGLAVEMLRQTIWFPLVAQPVWGPTLSGEHPYVGFPPLWPPWGQTDVIRRDAVFVYFPSLLLDIGYERVFATWLFQETTLPELFVRAAYVLPYAVLVLLAGREGWRSWRTWGQGGAAVPVPVRCLRLLLFFGAVTVLSFNRPRDWVHLMVLYVPTLILLAPFAELLAGIGQRRLRRLVLSTCAGVTVVALAVSFWLTLVAREYYDSSLATSRASVRVTADAAAALNPLLDTLALPDAETVPLASLPYSPALNFLARRPLATRFLTILPLEEFPDRQEQVLADLARDPRTEIIYSLQHAASIPLPQEYVPRLFAALVERYQLGSGPGMMFNGTRGDGLLFVRLEPRPPSDEVVLFDFADHLADASVTQVGGPDSPHTVAAQDARVRLAMWPFERPVVVVRAGVQPARTQLAFEVSVPPGTRLRFGVAMSPDEWRRFLPGALRFVVRIDGGVVFDAWVDPTQQFEDRRWQWADIPVSEPGLRTFAFETSTDNPLGALPNLAGFARPRLVAEGTD